MSAEGNKKQQQLLMASCGVVVVGVLSYYYWTSQSNEPETKANDKQQDDADSDTPTFVNSIHNEQQNDNCERSKVQTLYHTALYDVHQKSKKINPPNSELAVSGYIRELKHKININIPADIVLVIIMLYPQRYIFEEDNKYYMLSGVEMNTITKIKKCCWRNTLYSAEWIPSNQNKIYQWKIRYIQNVPRTGKQLIIGIISNDHHHRINRRINENGSYTFYNYGYLFDGKNCVGSHSSKLTEGHTLHFSLDLTKRQIMCFLDDSDQKEVLFKDIEKNDAIQYKLAISMYQKNDVITVESVSN